MSNDPTWVPEPVLFYATDGDTRHEAHHPDLPAVLAEAQRLSQDCSDVILVYGAADLPVATVFRDAIYKPEGATPEPTTDDARVFGPNTYVYCSQHLKAHQTGWCTVSVRDKVALGVDNAQDAYAKCRALGLHIYGDPDPLTDARARLAKIAAILAPCAPLSAAATVGILDEIAHTMRDQGWAGTDEIPAAMTCDDALFLAAAANVVRQLLEVSK
jgi:hypothetical protein